MTDQSSNWLVIILHIPHDAGEIRGSSDHDLVIELKAEDGRIVALGQLDCTVDNILPGLTRRANREEWLVAQRLRVGVSSCGSALLGRRRADDLETRPRVMSIPDANSAVSRAGDDFVSRVKSISI
jgi:hypothetical protein